MSPIDPLFLLAATLGVFLAVLGPAPGTRLAGAALALAAYISFAPWKGGVFLVVYVGTASTVGLISSFRMKNMSETGVSLIAALAGCLAAGTYLASTGGVELAGFEENLARELSQVGTPGAPGVLSGLVRDDPQALVRWLEYGARAFAFLSPAFIVLMTVACLFLTTSLLRSSHTIAPMLLRETPLAGFRFEDELVWALIAGLVLLIAPLPAWCRRVGANTSFAMGVLFLVRGMGVWVSVMAPRITSPLAKGSIVLAFFLLMPPLAAGLAFLSGLVDIWIDLRRRGQRKGTV